MIHAETICGIAGAAHVDMSAALNLSAATVTFVANEAIGGDGGAIHGASLEKMTMANANFFNNSARGRGGGMTLLMYEDAVIDECVFNNNTGLRGGGMWIGTGFGDINILNSTFNNNIAGAKFFARL